MGGFGSLLEYFGEQGALSNIQDFAEKTYRKSNPMMADWAQADPRTFRDAMSKIIPQQSMYNMGGNGGGALKDIAHAIANYQQAPMSGVQLRTPMGMAIQDMVLNENPEYDANVYAARKKTAQDMSPGGTAGQKINAAQTAINHLAAWYDSVNALNNYDVGSASKPLNALVNIFENQNPNMVAAQRYQSMAGDEIAKFVSGAGGSTEEDRREQRKLLSTSNSPIGTKAAAQSAIQTMFGKLEPIADQYNKVYGTNKTPYDFLSPETQKSLAAMGMAPEESTPKSALKSYGESKNRRVIKFSDLKQ